MVSRVAKNPIPVPTGVDVQIADALVKVKGKLGELSYVCPHEIRVVAEDGELRIVDATKSASPDTKPAREKDVVAKSGLVRSLVSNMVIGVSEGFECKLEMKGVGYRANVSGNTLNLSVGFSHPVAMEMPEGIKVACPAQTQIVVSGADKQLVFQIGANIRAVRPPEPYKGKGVRYVGERVVMKEVKKK